MVSQLLLGYKEEDYFCLVILLVLRGSCFVFRGVCISYWQPAANLLELDLSGSCFVLCPQKRTSSGVLEEWRYLHCFSVHILLCSFRIRYH